MKARISLSSHRAHADDIAAVQQALESGWIAPVGPEIDGFEADVCRAVGTAHAVALSSGTAALHLALRWLGVGQGDTVLMPTATFAATAFAVKYLGAEPAFVDVDSSWNLDPELLVRAIRELDRVGSRPKAVIAVDLYGTPANYPDIMAICDRYSLPLVEDAAEALGAHGANGRKAGHYGIAGVLSFNGNKLLTTGGGGMLVTDSPELASKARYWATQARESVAWYEHREVGFNYRLSNVLAALGRSQMRRLSLEVSRRRSIRERYRTLLGPDQRFSVQSDPRWGRSNAWLTVARLSGQMGPEGPSSMIHALAVEGIESRRTWKPMHQQPVFRNCKRFVSGAAELLFEEGICLPSSSHLTNEEVDEICSILQSRLGG